MNIKHFLLPTALALAATAAAVPAGAAPAATPNYHLLQKVVLGGEGGWDYLAVDPDARRVYISRGSHVMVVDADSEKVIGDIPNTNGVHGIAIASKLGRGFTSNGRDNAVTIFDLKTLQTISTVPLGAGIGPDCIIYEPKTQRVFTFNGRSSDATAIDAATGKVLATIPLGGRPEFAAVDGTGIVYDNLESTSEVVALDAQALTIKNRWSVAPQESPSGLAIDPKTSRLFSVCDNNRMVISNGAAGKVESTAGIGAGPDAAGFDPGTGLAFSSNGQDGTLTVLRQQNVVLGQKSFNIYAPVQSVSTQAGARTMAVDTKTHRVFLVTATPDPTSPGQGRRRNYIPGSFTLLVVGQ